MRRDSEQKGRRMFREGRKQGKLPEWPNGADCKSAGVRLRWFESITSHKKEEKKECRLELHNPEGAGPLAGRRRKDRDSDTVYFCGSSSVDRALAFQAKGREFEPRLPLSDAARVMQGTERLLVLRAGCWMNLKL